MSMGKNKDKISFMLSAFVKQNRTGMLICDLISAFLNIAAVFYYRCVFQSNVGPLVQLIIYMTFNEFLCTQRQKHYSVHVFKSKYLKVIAVLNAANT